MKYLLSGAGWSFVFYMFNLYAAGYEQTVRIEETVLTTRLYTKISVLESTGFGQGGVPVIQTHTFESVSEADEKFTSAQKTWSETEIAQAVLQGQAVSIKVVGKQNTKGLQEGEYLSEVKSTFTLLTTHPGLKLSMEGAEILEGRDNKRRLKLLIGLKNLTHQPLNLTKNSFRKGDFFLEGTSPSSQDPSMKIGRVIYDLPEIHGSYTLEIPAHLP